MKFLFTIVFIFLFGTAISQVVPSNPSTQTYNSISALTATVGIAGGFRVTLLGFYAAGDGGGGAFYWDAFSTASAVPGLVVKPTAVFGGGRWIRIYSLDYVSVLWFGAKCDGSTDDYLSVQTALNVGGNVNFPTNKTCLMSLPVSYSKSYTHVFLNGTQTFFGSSSTFNTGGFNTNNTTPVFTDVSTSVTITAGLNWFLYSGFANLSTGEIVQVTGNTINGNYKVGILGIISRINGDTIFTNVVSDTTFSATNLHAYTKLTKISIEGGAISANGNTNAFGVAFFGCSESYIRNVVYKGTGSQVGLEIISCFDSRVDFCSVDSCLNTANSLGYAISTNGQNNILDHNTVSNSKHDLTSGSNNFTSNNIIYSYDVCSGYTLLNTLNIDMHAQVRGSIIGCIVNTSSTTGIQIRGKGQNVIGCTVNIDNSIFNSTTVKAIDALEDFAGYSEIGGNTVNIIHGSGSNFFGLCIEGNIYPNAPNMYIHNNTLNNAGLMVLTQNMDNALIDNNVLNADTLTFNGILASGQLTNFKIRNPVTQNKLNTGSAYAIHLANTAQTVGEISGGTYYQWHENAPLIQYSSTTTGISAFNNYFYTTTANSTISDPSSGQQNPSWNNQKIDSTGTWSVVAYATSPAASQLYEGKTVLIASGSTTIPNTCQKTGVGTWSFIAITAAGSTWTRSGNYLFGNNFPTDSVAIGQNTPTAILDVLGVTKNTLINANTSIGSGVVSMNNGALRQTVTGGTNMAMEGYKIGVTASAGDSIGIVRFFNANFSAISGNVTTGYGFNVAGGSLTGFANIVGLEVADATVSGVMKAVDFNVANGTNKWNVYAGGTASNYLQGQLRVGSFTDVFSGAPQGLYVATQSRYDSIMDIRSGVKYHQTITGAGTYVITGDDYDIIFTGSTSTWTLPTITNRHLNLVNQGTGTITLGTAVTTANGVSTTTLTAGNNLQIVGDVTNSVWRKIN